MTKDCCKPSSKYVGLPDKTTDHPVARSLGDHPTLDQGHPNPTKADTCLITIEPIDQPMML